MDTNNKILTAISLSMVIGLLFMYNQMNGIRLSAKNDKEGLMKRIESYDEFQSNFDNVFESKLKSMMDRSEKSDE